MPFFVVRLVLQDDLAVAIDRNPIVGSGRSSDVSQKSSECLPIKSSVHFGATFGAPALSVSPSSLPTNEMCPIGNSQSGELK